MNLHTKLFGVILAVILGLSLIGTLFWGLDRLPVAYAAGITVTTTKDEFDENKCSLREAIAAANLDTAVGACAPGSGHDVIQFDLGSAPAIITLTQGALHVDYGSLTIEGPGSNLLTISGGHASRIFNVGSGGVVALSGMTLRDGHTGTSGGAIHSSGALTLTDVTLINNTAGAEGGAINTTGNLTLQNSHVLSNTASGEGGGINAFGQQVNIINSTFRHNHSGSIGGALYTNGALTIAGANFSGNSAQSLAGGVWVWNEAHISDAIFEQNSALNLQAGAIYVYHELQLTSSTFISNTAGQDIGAVLAWGDAALNGVTFIANEAGNGRTAALQARGSLWLTDTQWLSNRAAAPGGALVHLGQNGRIVNALFANNENGAATFEHNGSLEMLHATLVGPEASTAAALTLNNAGGSLTVTNSIFSGYHTGMELVAGAAGEDHNLFHDNTPVSGAVTRGSHSYAGDPAFVNAAAGDYHLSAASEALNTGVNAGIAVDLDGDARPGGGGVDLGYDETSYVSDAAMSKEAFTAPGPAQPITYTLTFANVGTAMLPRLTITDHLPVQVSPLTVSSSVPVTAVHDTTPLVWQVHNLPPGASETITISGVLADVLPYGLLTNTVTIHSPATEEYLANNTAVAAITIPNVPPIAVDDVFTIGEDEAVLLQPTLNDIDGDALHIVSFAPPGHGTAALSGTQQIVYTPTLNYNGFDSFGYTVSDGQSQDSATISLTITAVNDPPAISEGAHVTRTISEDSDPVSFALTLHAADPENSPLIWSVTAAPQHGQAMADAGPANSSNISYTPNPHYFGADQFQVQVYDGALTDSVTIHVVILPINDAPVAVDDTAVVLRRPSGEIVLLAAGSSGSLNVLDNDEDVEEDPLTVIDVGSPDQGGAVQLNPNGHLQSYTPADGFVGQETFTYTIDDGEFEDTAVVHLTVANGLDGGVGGDSLLAAGLGQNDAFDLSADIPANVANGANAAFILHPSAESHSAAPAAPTGYVPAGLTFSLAAYLDGRPVDQGHQFAAPITLILTYPQADVANIGPSENSLALFFHSDGGWSDSGVQVVERDTKQHRLVIKVSRSGAFTLFRRSFVYLPLTLNNYAHAPDLIVESVTVVSPGSAQAAGDVQVIIKNAGNAPATNEFWVDLYINPQTAPTAVNQTWEMLGDQGAAWGILADTLPLNPGESLTLTLSSPYYAAGFSSIAWPLAAETTLYAQVDSNNPGNSAGAVLEIDELSDAPYNNVSGPHTPYR